MAGIERAVEDLEEKDSHYSEKRVNLVGHFVSFAPLPFLYFPSG